MWRQIRVSESVILEHPLWEFSMDRGGFRAGWWQRGVKEGQYGKKHVFADIFPNERRLCQKPRDCQLEYDETAAPW